MRAPFLLRWLGKRTVSITVRSPLTGTLLKVSQHYLDTGISIEQLQEISFEEALGIMAAHGRSICLAVATAWLNGYWKIRFFAKPLAWYMRWHCSPQEISTIATMILLYGGTSDFMNTTRSVRQLKITSPMMGQKSQGS